MSAPLTVPAPAAITAASAFAGLFGFGVLWGATIPLTKLAVSAGHHPLGLIVWQLLFTGLALLVVSLVQRRRWHFGGRHVAFYLIVAFIGTIIPNSFSYVAAARLPAGIMALAVASVPMMALLLALALGNETFRPHRVAGIALGVVAMMLIALPEASLPDPALAIWLPVALVAPFCYALEGNYFARFAPKDIDPVSGLAGAALAGFAVTAPLVFSSGLAVDLRQPWQASEYALLASALCHAGAYVGYMWLVGRAGVVFSSQIAYMVTGSAIVFSLLFLGERYSAFVWAAIGLMMLALALVQPRKA